MADGSLKVSWIFSWVSVMFISVQEKAIEDKLKLASRCLFYAGKRVMKVFDWFIIEMSKLVTSRVWLNSMVIRPKESIDFIFAARHLGLI